MSRRRKQPPRGEFELHIDSLSHDGRGVGRLDGKAVFVHGALPGETVVFAYERVRRRYDEGRVLNVLDASPHRVEPFCPHFDLCGGCSLQHLDSAAQLAAKERVLLEGLQRLGNVVPEKVLPRMTGPDRGYRNKARLGVRYVIKKERVLVGFREKRSNFIADLGACPVLHPSVGTILNDLASLIQGLSIFRAIPQIEVAVGDDDTALVLRHLEPLLPEDSARLINFADAHGVRFFVQPGGEETVTPLDGGSATLSYSHPAYGCSLSFRPTDFTQVNGRLNRQLVQKAVALLDVAPGHKVLDLFCGIGNFTLPLAAVAREVAGVEGDAGLVARAATNAQADGCDSVRFYVSDLFTLSGDDGWRHTDYDRVLIDPPRSGAQEVLPVIAASGARRVVYVSCNPATLARDAGILVHTHGFRLLAAGVADMFPHTAHVESIAVFAAG